MAAILVVGQEQRSLERFYRVLSAEGFRVQVAQGHAQALAAAAGDPPSLVLAAAEMPGADQVASAFRRSAGGPGVVVVLAEGAAAAESSPLGDDRLRLPVTDQELVGAVRRMLAAPKAAAGTPSMRLTSHQIFGDVLAEVEQQLGGRTPFPPGPPPQTPPRPAQAAAPAPPPRPAPAPATSAAASGTGASVAPPGGAGAPAARPASRDGDDLQRKLEQTLSGMLGPDPRRDRPASAGGPGAAARRADAAADDVEARLSKTLSELGARPRAAAPARPAAPPAGAASAGSAAAAGSAPALPAAAAPGSSLGGGAGSAGLGAPGGAAAPAVGGGSKASPGAAGGSARGLGLLDDAAFLGALSDAGVGGRSPFGSPAGAVPGGGLAGSAAGGAQDGATPAGVAAGGPSRIAPPPLGAGTEGGPAAPGTSPGAAPPYRVSPAATSPFSLPASPAGASPSAAQAPSGSAAPAGSAPTTLIPRPDFAGGPGPGPAASVQAPSEGTGVRRRFTGELDLSQIEEMARTRRKPDAASRPGIPLTPPPAASPAPPPQAPRPTVSVAPPPGLVDSAAATQRIQMVPRESGGTPVGERFGQYTLLERIAVGGMAEVWKARMRGVEGFQKTVAIKKILPYMTDNADFVGMFIDEAKLAAQLSHPNIIHIYDLGKIGANFYIAMEYVEGRDLRSLLNAGRNQGLPLPLGLALLIAVRLASALDYAHRKRDFEGRDMDLVHRDVSPQNVLISFDGDVKLCDFGIAKAVSKVGQTQMGALKGKLQYMSPEQARGSFVDARSDIFSLGTVLFEMLTGERLFDGESEMSVLESVRQVKVRSPRQVDPTIPREVDEIVMRALGGRPEERFQSASELEQRLEAVLFALKPSPSHGDLAAYIRRVFAQPAPPPRLERSASGAPVIVAPPELPAAPVASPAATAHPLSPALPPPQARPAAAPPPPVTAAPHGAMAPMPPIAPPAPLPPTAAAYAPGVAGVAAAGAVAMDGASHAAEPFALPSHGPSDAAAMPAEAAPLAPLGEVRSEEGPRRGRLILAVAVVAVVLLVVLLWVIRSRRGATVPPIGVPPAAQAQSGGPGSPAAAGGVAAGAAAVGSAAAGTGSAAASKVDVEGLVGQELARREEALKQKFEAQQKALQAELEKTKGKGQGSAAAGSGSAAKTPPAATLAAPQASAPLAVTPPPAAVPRAPAPEPSAAPAVPAAAPPPAVKERPAEAAAAAAGSAAAGSAAAERAPAADRGGAPAHAAVTEAPKLVSSIKPEYPPLARKLRVEGVVVLSVLVDEDGHVEDVQLLEPVGQNVGINEAALAVARGARFKPASRDGVRVKMWTRLRIPFKLQQ